MKRFYWALVILALGAIALPLIALAAAGVVWTTSDQSNDLRVVTATWTADHVNGTVANSQSPFVDGCVSRIVTNPGSPAPQDNYDMTLLDVDGVDISGGLLANRHTTTTQAIHPLVGTLPVCEDVLGPLTLTHSNSTVIDAVGTVKIYIRPFTAK